MINGRKTNFFWNEKTGSYEELKNVELEGIRKALQSKNKYAEMVYADALENKVAWEHIKDILLYSAGKVPEITDDYTMIDKAMVWGYNWEKGPFQIWDAIGLKKSVEKNEGGRRNHSGLGGEKACCGGYELLQRGRKQRALHQPESREIARCWRQRRRVASGYWRRRIMPGIPFTKAMPCHPNR